MTGDINSSASLNRGTPPLSSSSPSDPGLSHQSPRRLTRLKRASWQQLGDPAGEERFDWLEVTSWTPFQFATGQVKWKLHTDRIRASNGEEQLRFQIKDVFLLSRRRISLPGRVHREETQKKPQNNKQEMNAVDVFSIAS